MLRKKQIASYIDANFGKSPLDGGMYYDGTGRMKLIREYHEMRECESEVDAITWEDLEMDRIFLSVNHTNCFAGEQVLYDRLHRTDSLSDADEAKKYERQLEAWMSHPKERLQVEEKLYEIGKFENDYLFVPLIEDAKNWKLDNLWLLHLMQVLLAVCLFGTIVLQSQVCGVGLTVVITINLMIYLRTKNRYEVFFSGLGCLKKLYDFAEWITSGKAEMCLWVDKQRAMKAVNRTRKLVRKIMPFGIRKQGVNNGELSAILADYLWGITLMDCAALNHVVQLIAEQEQAVCALYKFAGETDAQIAVASYRKSRTIWCKPEAEHGRIEARGLVHPLLKNAVGNDFILEDRAILTGANASGKSTFMKAVAINAILAQTIHTCTAEKFGMENVHVMTCMSLRDDVESGESYYFREAKYLRRILDRMKENGRVFCVIDEIFKGTNTTERIAASKAVLEYLARTDGFVLVATHDREIVDSAFYHKYYFDSKVMEHDIVFDYKIREGIGGKSNAIALLELLGYPREIVQKARKYAI